jgi:tetratricopeptide (TPR) repeat protein
MHRIDDAVKMLNNRLSKNGSDSSAYFQLYSALLARGDSKAALSALRAALAVATAPTSDTMAVALAYELEEQGSSAEAERLLRGRLVGRSTANDDLLRLGLAWILLSRGDRAQSPAMLQETSAWAGRPPMRFAGRGAMGDRLGLQRGRSGCRRDPRSTSRSAPRIRSPAHGECGPQLRPAAHVQC